MKIPAGFVLCLVIAFAFCGCTIGSGRAAGRTISEVLEQGGMELIPLTGEASMMVARVGDLVVSPIPMPWDVRRWRQGTTGYLDGRIIEAENERAIARYFIKSGRLGYPILIAEEDLARLDPLATYRFYGRSTRRNVAMDSPSMNYFLVYAAEPR